ncbi:hypothetical protein BdWA1_000423 [Babesia duncani]|uniref:Uncharacterized protein n=1 Tax=Babesia duncani TaxID=323732 RepID=A0AAD9UPT6_9APIC|nr:hypothetical protein BdWA1_000423 [Babesia duncani]
MSNIYNGKECSLHNRWIPPKRLSRIALILFLVFLFNIRLWILNVEFVECISVRQIKRNKGPPWLNIFKSSKNGNLRFNFTTQTSPRRLKSSNFTSNFNCIAKCTLKGNLGFIKTLRHGGNREFHVRILPEDDKHYMLKELYLKRDEYFKEDSGTSTSLYRYFNITKENIEAHLNATMTEFFEEHEKENRRTVSIVDGNSFNGDYTNWKLPLPANMTAYEFEGLHPQALKPIAEYELNIKPKFGDDMLDSIYDFISEPEEAPATNATREFLDLYDTVGDCEYDKTDDLITYRKHYLQDIEYYVDKEQMEDRRVLHRVLVHPTMFPSYLDPTNAAHRTGRRREIQKRADSGRLQRLRWKMDVDYKDDILRGNWTRGDNITKEFIDSIEWEQNLPTYHDANFFKRSYYESGFGDEDRTVDNYFDVQFIGSTDAYPFAVSAGMQFSWPIYWVPMLCKTHPKRRGQPLRSQMFNLGGIEPLQLWFYPEGCAQTQDGYCSLKLVSPPGWCLPYRIYLFIASEYNRVTIGPMYRESASCLAASLNFCRLIDKSDGQIVAQAQNNADYVVLGPAGNVYVGVGIVDEPIRKSKVKHSFKYDWDEGDHDMLQWLKKQTADPDDENSEKTYPKEFVLNATLSHVCPVSHIQSISSLTSTSTFQIVTFRATGTTSIDVM